MHIWRYMSRGPSAFFRSPSRLKGWVLQNWKGCPSSADTDLGWREPPCTRSHPFLGKLEPNNRMTGPQHDSLTTCSNSACLWWPRQLPRDWSHLVPLLLCPLLLLPLLNHRRVPNKQACLGPLPVCSQNPPLWENTTQLVTTPRQEFQEAVWACCWGGSWKLEASNVYTKWGRKTRRAWWAAREESKGSGKKATRATHHTRPENPTGAVHGKAQSVLHLLKQRVRW